MYDQDDVGVEDAKEIGTQSRKYSHSPILGEVTVRYSLRLKYPKYHLEFNCEGLDSTPIEAQGELTFPNALTLGLTTEGRPCRMCTLESTLITVLSPAPTFSEMSKEGLVFCSFTSQANPSNPDSNIANFAWTKATASGEARLRRIAELCGMQTILTSAGIAAYGLTSVEAADVVSTNLRTVIRPFDKVPSIETIECAWSLLNDDPPEMAQYLGVKNRIDAWETARLLLL